MFKVYITGPRCHFFVENLEASRRYIASVDCCTSRKHKKSEYILRSPEVSFVTLKPALAIVKDDQRKKSWIFETIFGKQS